MGYPVERRITNLISQISHIYLNIIIIVRRLLKIVQMMSEGNMNVSEHFRKYFKRTEDFRSWSSMSEVDPKIFRLYMLSNIKWSIYIVPELFFFFFVTFLVKRKLHLFVNPYSIWGQVLHLWSRLIAFAIVITFVVNYYVRGFRKGLGTHQAKPVELSSDSERNRVQDSCEAKTLISR